MTLRVRGPRDLGEAQRQARRLARAVGLRQDAVAELLIAVTALVDHLYLASRRAGRLVFRRLRKGGRRGLEIVALIDVGGQWAIDLPPVERLVDELDAGFERDGGLRVTARKWACGKPLSPLFEGPCSPSAWSIA